MKKIEKESHIWTKVIKTDYPYYKERIESKRETGIPDVLIINKKGETIFVELKIVDSIIKKYVLDEGEKLLSYRISPKVRESQKRWFYSYPGKSCLVTYVKSEKKFVIQRGEEIRKTKDTDIFLIRCNGVYTTNFLDSKELIKKLTEY